MYRTDCRCSNCKNFARIFQGRLVHQATRLGGLERKLGRFKLEETEGLTGSFQPSDFFDNPFTRRPSLIRSKPSHGVWLSFNAEWLNDRHCQIHADGYNLPSVLYLAGMTLGMTLGMYHLLVFGIYKHLVQWK